MKHLVSIFLLFSCLSLQAQNTPSVLVHYRVKYFLEGDTTTIAYTINEYITLARNNEVSNAYIGYNNFVDFNKNETTLKSGARFYHQYQNLKERYFMSLLGTTTIKGNNAFLLLKDTMAVIGWEFLKKSKIIQTVECFAAQTEYRGRVWTAWYAPSIPISSGPWLLYGLPGMILEAEDSIGAVKIKCLHLTVEPSAGEIVKTPFIGKGAQRIVSANELRKIYEKTVVKNNKKSDNIASFGMNNYEIYDFEKDFKRKRLQQKLSETPKK